MSQHPHFGFTKTGRAVHQRTIDHHPAGSPYQRFNRAVALLLTKSVGTMTCFWLFCLLALCSLPSVLSAFSPFAHTFPAWMVKVSIIALVAWVAQTMIQLVLLPALMVGQNLQNQAADARAVEDVRRRRSGQVRTDRRLDRLDVNTAGGIKAILDAVNALRNVVTPTATPAAAQAGRT